MYFTLIILSTILYNELTVVSASDDDDNGKRSTVSLAIMGVLMALLFILVIGTIAAYSYFFFFKIEKMYPARKIRTGPPPSRKKETSSDEDRPTMIVVQGAQSVIQPGQQQAPIEVADPSQYAKNLQYLSAVRGNTNTTQPPPQPKTTTTTKPKKTGTLEFVPITGSTTPTESQTNL